MKTLADRAQAFLASPWADFPVSPAERKVIGPNFVKLRSRLRAARRFRLDNDFVEAAVRVASCGPDVAMRRAALANLPFDDVWLEWDQEVRCRMQEAIGTSAPLDDHDRGFAGFLIMRDSVAGVRVPDRWHATPFLSRRDPDDVAVIGLVSQALLPITDSATDGPPDEISDAVVSGWGYRIQPGEDGEDLAARLIAIGGTSPEIHCVLPIMGMRKGMKLWRGYLDHARESRGDLRFITTVLAMLNTQPIRYVETHNPGRFTRRLNSMSYLDSSIVSIHADSTRIAHVLDRAAADEAAARRKRHEVRGHWALAEYKTGLPPCRHLPAEGMRDGAHSICGRCERLIVWREHHERGDASLGWVQHEYEVSR